MNTNQLKMYGVAAVAALFPLSAAASESTPSLLPATLEKPALVVNQPAAAPAPAAKPFKVGYVDIARIGQESDYGKAVKAELLKKKKMLEDKVIAKRKQLEKYKQTIETKLPGFSEKQREAESKK